MSIGKSKNKKERNKINDDIALMWLNWSVATLIAMLQLLEKKSLNIISEAID